MTDSRAFSAHSYRRNANHQASNLAVELRQVAISFDGLSNIVEGVNLEVQRSEHVAIVGLSGSGKTTLLQTIAGKITACSGDVSVFGRVAMIHQDLRLVGQSTVLENVCHGALAELSFLRGVFGIPQEIIRRAEQLIADVGLLHRKHVPVYRLSGGERQRVAIARALISSPDVLLADEPTASLDEVNAAAIMKLLREIQLQRGISIVSVLHNEPLAQRFTDRVIVLNRGALCVAEGSNTLEWEGRGGNTEHCMACPIAVVAGDIERTLTPLQLSIFVVVALALYAWAIMGIEISDRSIDGAAERFISFLSLLVPTTKEDLFTIPWNTLFHGLLETARIALLGTTLGAVLSFPLAAMAIDSKKTSAARSLVRKGTRWLLNGIRSVPSLIWALLFTASVGFGPFAGVLALTVYSIGYLSKFFYEAFEGIDPKTPEALRDFGASGLQRFRYAIWPAALPGVLSSLIFMLEYNVRAATILGVVDAGGIGFYIKQYIDFRFFPAVTAALLMILCVVVGLDILSQKVRSKLVKRS